MIVKTALFKTSNTNPDKCPDEGFPEYAFIGRSNVGKSSLINMLCNQKGLAKTSSKPGKTRLINHFLINNSWYIVDLPGYGFAKASQKEKDEWQKMIRRYLFERNNLYCVFVLIDTRLEPQKNDLDFINMLGENNIAFCIIGTKADKLSQTKAVKNLELLKKEMQKTWESMPRFFITSSENKQGRDEILDFIETINNF